MGTSFRVAFVVGASALIGLLPSVTGSTGALIVLALGITALGLLVVRHASASPPRLLPGSRQALSAGLLDARKESGQPEAPGPRIPRALFYLGALTVSMITLRPVLGVNVSELFFIAAFAGSVCSVLGGHPVARVPVALAIGVGVFTFGGAISSLGAFSSNASFTEVLQGIYVMLLWFWTGTMLLRTGEQLRAAVSLWTISAAVCGLGAVWQTLGVETFTGPLQGGRATSWAGHPNELGGLMAVSLLPALALATHSGAARTRLARTLRWLAVSLIGAGLLLSGSVGSMLGGMVGVMVWLSLPSVRTPLRATVTLGLVAIVATAVLGAGRVTSPIERLELVTTVSATNYDAGSGAARVAQWKAAWEGIKDSPVVGHGLDDASRGVQFVDNGINGYGILHGVPIVTWYAAGAFGFLGYLIILWSVARTGWAGILRERSDDERSLGWSLLAAFLAFFIYSWTEPFVFTQYGWLAAVTLVAWCARRDALGQPATIRHEQQAGTSAAPRLRPA
jgi:O-antigen ligase